MKEEKNPHVLLSINLPFAQADTDYCSKGQTFLLYCQINAHQGVQVFRFPSNNHFEHTEENVQHIQHTHPRLNGILPISTSSEAQFFTLMHNTFLNSKDCTLALLVRNLLPTQLAVYFLN